MSFWGVVIKSSAPHQETVPQNANLVITNVALTPESEGKSSLYCNVEGTKTDILISSLSNTSQQQAQLNLMYPPGTVAQFSVKGKGEVHLIGCYEPLEIDDDDDYDSDELRDALYNEEDDSIEESEPLKKLGNPNRKILKITELKEGEEEDEEDDEEDEEDDEGEDGEEEDDENEKVKNKPNKEKNGDLHHPVHVQQQKKEKPQQSTNVNPKKRKNTSPPPDSKKQKLDQPTTQQGSSAKSTPSGEFKCVHCDRSFKMDSGLQQHLQAKHQQK